MASESGRPLKSRRRPYRRVIRRRFQSMSAVFRSLRVLPTPSNFLSSLTLPVSYRTRAFGKPNRSLRWSETTVGKSDLFVSRRDRSSGGGSRPADVRCVAPEDRRVVVVPDARYIDHFSFIEDVASARAPESLNQLLNMVQAQGETLISPAAKEGLIPLVIPLSESPSGKLTSLLRWPTSPPGMEMPVVEVHKHGVWLLAKSVDQYIHRMLVEEDADVENSNKLWDASAEAGQKLYKKGDLLQSGIADLDIYLLKKVGLFPDVIERKISRHLEKGDQVSAMITGEFYTKQHFPGFGRPFAFNAQILLKVGRNLEAKDAARGSLKSPWWTLGFKYKDVADIAEWEDEQIEYVKEKITEEGRKEDLKKGKAPEQVALDEAAFLMDLASIDGSWDDEVVHRIAECYMEAGLHDIAKFIAFRE